MSNNGLQYKIVLENKALNCLAASSCKNEQILIIRTKPSMYYIVCCGSVL